MKAFSLSYTTNSAAEAILPAVTNQANTNFSVIALATGKPKITVLKKTLLLELQQLVKSFQAQLRNSVALITWLHAKSGAAHTAVSANAQEMLAWQSAFGESLSFRLVASPEAFTLFTDTLLRKSYFLHYHAQVNLESQLLKVQVATSRLPELEQELSIVFENIKPVNYLETRLSQKQPMRYPKQLAG